MSASNLKTCGFASLLLVLSFPPFPLGFLSPIALAMLIALMSEKTAGDAFRLGYVNGIIWGSFTLYWIGANTVPGAAIAILINSLHYAFVWWMFRIIHRRRPELALWSFPALWTAVEYLRHFSDLRFNWLNLAYTQTYYTPFIQFVEWSGYLGLSFLLALMSVLLYKIIFRKTKVLVHGFILLLLVLLPLVYGLVRIPALQTGQMPAIKVGLVQPNVDPFQKWEPAFQDSAYRLLEKATLQMADEKPALVVWPETATPFFLRSEEKYLSRVFRFVDSLQLYLITGTPDFQYVPRENDYRTFNAAFFFAPGKHYFQTYYKMALVPAAESMPFKKALPFLRKLDVGGGDFFSGREFTVFEMRLPASEMMSHSSNKNDTVTTGEKEIGVSTIICFESIFPQLVRQFVKSGARLLTIITNDGWFGNTSGPYQHAQYAVLRAVENRVSIVRCANTGISMFIDPAGRILKRASLNTFAALLYPVPISDRVSFYTRFGDLPGLFSLIFSVGLIGYVFVWKRKIEK